MSGMQKMILIPVDKYERMKALEQRYEEPIIEVKKEESPPPPQPPVVAPPSVQPIARPPGHPNTSHPIRRRPSKSVKWIKLH
jgi:hypothetical protein